MKNTVKVINGKSTSDNESILEISDIVNLWIIFSAFSGMIMGLGIGYLFIYQTGNMNKNLTTVEEMITSKVKKNSPFSKGNYK